MDSLPSKIVEHVVFFNVKEGTPPEKTNAWISALQGLNSLDQVLQLTAGPALRFSSGTYKYTHALHSRYKDKQSLAEYSGHPDHVHVVKDIGLPIVDDVFGLDWEADLGGFAMPCYGAIRVAIFKPKEGLAEQQRAVLVEILHGYKDMFSSVMQVYEGERSLTKDYRELSKFDLSGIPPAPRGVPQIEVTFEVDANGILNVRAEDKGTKKSEKITITNDKGRLSQEEIERMVQEAEEFAEEDKKVKERIDARNNLETYVYNMKSTINEKDKLVDKIDSEDNKKIENALKEALDWLDENQSAEKDDFEEKLKEVEALRFT